ncbi:MAG: rhomboid family intramembrane serine protease, partial [Candidatus Hodarchaeota archaeon]
LIIFLISGLIANLSYLILLPMNSTGLGSSGAIFGLIGVNFIIITSKKKYHVLFLLLLTIILFLYISLTPSIVFWAHLFGFIGGILIGYLFFIYKRKIREIY